MATIKTIGIGDSPNDREGDTAREGGQKINENFSAVNTELVTATSNITDLITRVNALESTAIHDGWSFVNIFAKGEEAPDSPTGITFSDVNGFSNIVDPWSTSFPSLESGDNLYSIRVSASPEDVVSIGPIVLVFTALSGTTVSTTLTAPTLNAFNVGYDIPGGLFFTVNNPVENVTYTFTAQNLPNGITISSTGQILGTPLASGSFGVTVTATGSDGNIFTVYTIFFVNPEIDISIPNLYDLSVGIDIQDDLFFNIDYPAFNVTYTWAGTNLPDGITINSNTGELSGEPETFGQFNSIITATGSDNNTYRVTVTFNVMAAPGLSTPLIPRLTVGMSITDFEYSFAIARPAHLVTYTYTATGLPNGININFSTGDLEGTPTDAGVYNAIITATGSDSNTYRSIVEIQVNSRATFPAPSIPTIEVGVSIPPIQFEVANPAANEIFSFTATNLPDGLVISSTGLVTGTPTEAGEFTFTVNAFSSLGTQGDLSLTITVTILDEVSLTASSIPEFTTSTNVSVSNLFTINNPRAGVVYTYTARNLPSRLRISSTGDISGTPTVAGSFTVTIIATGSDGNVYMLDITIVVAAATALRSPIIPNLSENHAIPESLAFVVTNPIAGETFTYTTSGLPTGLTLSTSGVLEGTPTEIGTFQISVTATGSAGNIYTVDVSITVVDGPALTAPTIPLFIVDIEIQSGLLFTITNPVDSVTYTYSSTSLPDGITISSDGELQGTPIMRGSYLVTVTASGSDGNIYTVNADIEVHSQPEILAPVEFPYMARRVEIPADERPQFTLRNPTPNVTYTWSIPSLTFLRGFEINNDGVLSGTPTNAGSFTFTITATGSDGNTYTLQVTDFVVNQHPSVTSFSVRGEDAGSRILLWAGIAVPDNVRLVVDNPIPDVTYTFSAEDLPTGVTVSDSGLITGTPESITGGSFTSISITVTITGSDGTTFSSDDVFGNILILINQVDTPPSLSSPNIPDFYIDTEVQSGVRYSMLNPRGDAEYQFTATGLPDGITINSSTGELEGAATEGGTFTIDVTVIDTDLDDIYTYSATSSVTVLQPSLVSPTIPYIAQDTAVEDGILFSIQNPVPGVTYVYSATGLPGGMDISAAGELEGTPTQSGTFDTTIIITGSDGNTYMDDVSIVVNPAVTILSPTIPITPINVEIDSDLTFIIQNPIPDVTYTWSAINLPDGITLSSDGELQGTPTDGGTFMATITATGSDDNTYTVDVSIHVAYLAAPTIPFITANEEIPSGLIFVVEESPSGVTYQFTASGLPTGITINSSTGELEGTPTDDGMFTATITATGSDANTYTADVSIDVNPSISLTAPTIPYIAQDTEIPSGIIFTIQNSDPGVTYTFTATDLPAGLTINTDGHLQGTPTEQGTSSATITATGSDSNTYTTNVSIHVNPPVTVLAPTIPYIAQDTEIASGLIFTIQNPFPGVTYTFTANDLPDGIIISPDGILSGTPTEQGTSSATITATGSDSNTYTVDVTIVVSLPVSLTAPTIPYIAADEEIPSGLTFTIQNSIPGVTYTFSAENLPDGIIISSDGILSGNPTEQGTSSATITATGSDSNTYTVDVTITINAAVSINAPATIPDFILNRQIRSGITFTIENAKPGVTYTWSATDIPAGITIDSSTGELEGTPTDGGTFNAIITATSSDSNTYTVNVTLTVEVITSLISPTIPDLTTYLAVPTDLIFTIENPISGVTYTYSATGLPPGVTLNSTSGQLEGNPSSIGTYSTTVTATGSDSNTYSSTVSITTVGVVFGWWLNHAGDRPPLDEALIIPVPASGNQTIPLSRSAGQHTRLLLQQQQSVPDITEVIINGESRRAFKSSSFRVVDGLDEFLESYSFSQYHNPVNEITIVREDPE